MGQPWSRLEASSRLLVIVALGCSGCSRCGSSSGTGPAVAGRILPELEPERPRYRVAMTRARAWLDALRVDPLELRQHGIKGKKKLVEQLEAYYKLWQVAPEAERPALIARVREVVAVTGEDRYHDMAKISDLWFKEDATSYLRAAVLMDRLGLDTRAYREQIRRIQPRLDAHLAKRGPHQRRVFHWYYRHFGLREPFQLGDALREGVIAQRRDPGRMGTDDVYQLTHEVYALYEYGDRLDVDPFDAGAKEYLRGAMATLMQRYVERSNPDLAGELLECMHYLRLQELPGYLEGARYLLGSQNSDGSFGRYEHLRPRLGDWVRHGFFLHTTLVAVGTLAAVFDRPMPAPRR